MTGRFPRLPARAGWRWRGVRGGALLVALALGLVAVGPLWTVPLPATHDGLNHLQRQVVFDALLRQGVLMPRWYPDFATGYGYPLGVYYPPLALYLAEPPLLLGSGPVLALRLAFTSVVLLGAVGSFLFCQRVAGSAAGGLLGATAYTFAPYLLVTVYERGALPEALALGLLPWALWTLDRWDGGRRGLALAASTLALLVLAHPVVAAAGWLSAGVWWGVARRRPLLPLALSFLGAAGLSAWFWLPALAAAGAAALDNFARLGSAAANVVPLERLVSSEVGYTYATLPYRLTALQLAGALMGLLISWWVPVLRRLALVAGGLCGAFALAASSLASGLWALPLLQPVQFPWRLLGLVALFAALLTALSARGRAQRAVLLVGIVLFGGSGLATLRPAPLLLDERALTVGAAIRREWNEGTIGTTTAAEYLPATARAAYAPGPLPPEVTRAYPPLLTAQLLEFDALGGTFQVVADQPTVLLLHQFWFPGWAAWLDGEPVSPFPEGPLGLVAVRLPAGEHRVTLRFGSTPDRLAATFLSLVSALALGWTLTPGWGLVAGLLGLVLLGATSALPRPQPSTLPPADLGPVRLLGGELRLSARGVETTLFWQGTRPGGERLTVRLRDPAGQILAESIAYPRWNTAHRWSANEVIPEQRELRPSPGPATRATLEVEAAGRTATISQVELPPRAPLAAPRLARASGARFGGRFELTGWEVSGLGAEATLPPAGTLTVTTGWSVRTSIPEDYTLFVHLLGPNGERLSQADGPPGGLIASSLLQPGEQFSDRRTLAVPAALAPGRYTLAVGWYLLRTGERLPVEGGTMLLLGPFKVPSRPATLPAVSPRDDRFGPITLVGAAVREGEVTLVWRAEEHPAHDYHVFVHLLDGAGRAIAQADGPPLAGRYPTSLWSAGETVIDQRALPPSPGAVQLVVGLYDPATGTRLGNTLVPLPGS
ncbi:MAG: hypothetical protein K6U89_09590 [Chloroflexi bacterium]|nr:hypothetical protein [Chloroflexota bacterium]